MAMNPAEQGTGTHITRRQLLGLAAAAAVAPVVIPLADRILGSTPVAAKPAWQPHSEFMDLTADGPEFEVDVTEYLYPNIYLNPAHIVSCGDDSVAMGGEQNIFFGKFDKKSATASWSRPLPLGESTSLMSMHYDKYSRRLLTTAYDPDDAKPKQTIDAVPITKDGEVEEIDIADLGLTEVSQVIGLTNGNLVIAGLSQEQEAYPYPGSSPESSPTLIVTDKDGKQVSKVKPTAAQGAKLTDICSLELLDDEKSVVISTAAVDGQQHLTVFRLDEDDSSMEQQGTWTMSNEALRFHRLRFIRQSPTDKNIYYYCPKASSGLLLAFSFNEGQPVLVGAINGETQSDVGVGVTSFTASDGQQLDAYVNYSEDPDHSQLLGQLKVVTATAQGVVNPTGLTSKFKDFDHTKAISPDGRWIYTQDTQELGRLRRIELNNTTHKIHLPRVNAK